ncbi:MAG: RNA methyltransferase [Alphaproteobacteria bacterium]|nr:RNA methyltransferase [Alphaproteobacteria bacterium]
MTTDFEITSAANPEIKSIRALNTKKGRSEQGAFLSEGLRHVLEAARVGWTIRRLLISKTARQGPLLEEARTACVASGGRVLVVPPALMERVAKRDNAQSVIAVIEQRRRALTDIPGDGPGVFLVLEDVRDPGNLGSILRTADAFGISGVLLVGTCCDPFSVEAVRASMGSVVNVPVTEADRDGFLAWHAGWRGATVGAHLKGTDLPRLRDLTGGVLILMGNEQAGLSAPLSDICETLVRIPMRAGSDSLNLAAAAAIMAYEATAAGLTAPE